MKKRLLTLTSIIFLLFGSAMLIIPQISNDVGKQQAHAKVEEFENIKNEISKANYNYFPNAEKDAQNNTKGKKAESNNYSQSLTITFLIIVVLMFI